MPGACAAQAADAEGEDASAGLATEQAELAQKFERLQTLAKRIAELAEADDPERAEQLRSAIRKSQDLALPERFESIVGLLEQEQLAAAARDQDVLSGQLQTLLKMLLADPNEARIEAERRRLREIAKQLERHIRTQRQLRSDSIGEQSIELATQRQMELAKEIEALEQQMPGSSKSKDPAPPNGDQQGEAQDGQPQEGQAQDGQPTGDEPQEGQPQAGQPQQGDQQPSSAGKPSASTPQQRATERMQQAQQRMQEAIEQLEQSEREGAERKQAEAQRNLEDAREEIEQALRQLREEEQQRRLAMLATRLRRMLSEQTDLLELTRQTEEDRPNRGRRATRVAARGLATREKTLVTYADGALRLLQEDGQSVAFPQVVEQIRDDMQIVATRMGQTKLARVTQQLEQDIIASLDEAVASLDKTLEDLEQREQNGQQGQPSGEPGEPPVVDKLAELRMIRALQARILRRTTMWDTLLEAGEATDQQVAKELAELAQRQMRLMQAVRNLDRPAGR